MQALILYGFLPAFVVAAALAWAASTRVRRVLGPRRFLWCALAAGMLLVFAGTAMVLVGGVRQGTSFCHVCGAHERRVTLYGLVLEGRAIAPDDPEAWMTREYVAWYQASAALEHEHGWTQAGEHTLGFGRPFGLHEFPPVFHRALPRLPDEAVARALVRRLAATPPEERSPLLRDFAQADEERGSVLMRRLSREPLSGEAFAADYAGWLAEHPLWMEPDPAR